MCSPACLKCLQNCWGLELFRNLFSLSAYVLIQVYNGKENHLELIHELRTVHALQREEQELQKANKELVVTLKKDRDKHRQKVKHKQTLIHSFSFTPAPNTFITHFLSPPRHRIWRQLRPER